MITSNFVFEAKYNLQSLGIRTNNVSEISLAFIKESVLDTLFRLKNLGDAFTVYYFYKFIFDHWSKIVKAMSSNRWIDTYCGTRIIYR